MSKDENEAFWKVLRTIETAGYVHLMNGTVLNLINNFNNMYKCKQYSDVLNAGYNERLKEFNN
jgi:hypothetical protein